MIFLQAEVSDVSFDLVDLQNKIDRVLEPTSVKLQSRYVKVASPAGHPVYQLEIALRFVRVLAIRMPT